MRTRRKFIGTTLGAGAALAAGAMSPVPQPAKSARSSTRKFISGRPKRRTRRGCRARAAAAGAVHDREALPLMDEAGVDRVVIVPPGLNDRNDYALEAVKRYPDRFAVMGRIPLKDPKSAALLPKWKEQPGMLGVRLTFNSPTLLGWLKDGTADWFWPAAEKAGLAGMFLTIGRAAFAPIAERHPQLTLIIDHMGLNTASRAKQARDPGGDRSGRCARQISERQRQAVGAARNSLEPYPFRDMTVHLQRVFDAYGPQRCHWGTDIRTRSPRRTTASASPISPRA